MEQTEGMKTVVSTYMDSGELIKSLTFYVDDEIVVMDEVDNVERFLFDQYDKYLEGGTNERTKNE